MEDRKLARAKVVECPTVAGNGYGCEPWERSIDAQLLQRYRRPASHLSASTHVAASLTSLPADLTPANTCNVISSLSLATGAKTND